MVTGGYLLSGPGHLDSTEILSDNIWRIVAGKLPEPTYGMKLANIDNRILMFGNIEFHKYRE